MMGYLAIVGDRTSKLEILNSLRGVAVLLVLFFHFVPGGLVSADFSAFTGILGVVLFFFLSGFFMDRTLSQDKNIVAFAVRRAARILPLYWFSLTAAFLIGNWTVSDLLVNSVFLVPFTKTELLSGVYWTLYIEIAFYAVVPVIALSGRKAIVASLYAAIALNIAVGAMRGHPSHTLYFMTFCLAGMQFGVWYRGKIDTYLVAAAAMAVVGHAVLLSEHPVSMGMAAALSSAAMYAALRCDIAHRTLLSPIGDISYSLYLLHAILGLPVTKLAAQAGLGVWLPMILGVVCSIVLSAATYRWIELPFMSLAHTALPKPATATIKLGH
jgi:exopolysaccharide production protein ExoZ